MKRYYALNLPAESKETGNNYPQLTFDNIKEASKFQYSFPETAPQLAAKLQKGSKLTDILSQESITGHGLVVSKNVCSVLSEYKIMDHRLYSCPIKDHAGTIHKYYWIAFVQPGLTNLIDYDKSEFYLKRALKNLGDIKLKDFDHYKEIKNTLDISTIVKLRKTVLTDIDYDLFQLPLFDSTIYVSRRLRDALSDFTGFTLSEAEL